MSNIKVPFFLWREGRPRWEPSPKLRKAGHKGRDLKDAAGEWLAFGAAIEEAARINAAIDAGIAPAEPPKPRTFADLFDAYLASRKFKGLGARTQGGYRGHIKTLREWCGDKRVASISRAMIAEFHGQLEDAAGGATANAVMRTLKLVVNFGIDDLEWKEIDKNRAARLDMVELDGRLVLWTLEEILAFVAWADALGLPSQADALLLGLLTGQRRGDVFKLPPVGLSDGRYAIDTGKTGADAFVTVTAPLRARLEDMAHRKAKNWPGVVFRHELVSSATGKPYSEMDSQFGYEFRAVRALAAGGLAVEDIARALGGLPVKLHNMPAAPVPSILSKQYRDLRDTAITWLFAANATEAEIATITGHSLKTVRAVLDKHYFVRNEEMAQAAGAKLDAYLAKKGMR